MRRELRGQDEYVIRKLQDAKSHLQRAINEVKRDGAEYAEESAREAFNDIHDAMRW